MDCATEITFFEKKMPEISLYQKKVVSLHPIMCFKAHARVRNNIKQNKIMAKNVNQEELQEEVVARPTATEWIEKNATWISWTILGILIVICGIIAVNKYVLQPKAVEASNENAKAVIYFESGNYEKALNGDDIDCLGFAEIAKKYSHYQQGKLAALYAGISEYKLGNYEEAATYLKKFSADDLTIDPATKLLLGNAYVELGELPKALSAFEDAAKSGNKLVAPIALKKAGIVCIEKGDNKKAQKFFQQIKDNYPMSNEAQDIDKYIQKYAE